MLDLPYVEDSTAEVDMNVVVLGQPGAEPRFVEVQGTAEGQAFSRSRARLAARSRHVGPGADHRPAGPAGRVRRRRRGRWVDEPAARCVSASANPHKVAEIASILDGLVELVPRPRDIPEVVEDAGTLEGNARLKAAAICAATGLPRGQRRHRSVRRRAATANPGVDTAYYAGPARHVRREPRRSCCAPWQASPIAAPRFARW